MAKPSKLPAITEDMVRRWLAEARAPQPWDFEALPSIVLNLDALRQQTPYHEEQARAKKPIDRAQKAIDELRRALTALLGNPAFKSEEEFWTKQPGGAATDFQRRTASARTMLASLVDISARHPVNTVSVELARDAYQFYQHLVPPPNKSSPAPDNPARLFVERAVRAMGGKPPGASRLHSIITTRNTAADRYAKQHGIAIQRAQP